MQSMLPAAQTNLVEMSMQSSDSFQRRQAPISVVPFMTVNTKDLEKLKNADDAQNMPAAAQPNSAETSTHTGDSALKTGRPS